MKFYAKRILAGYEELSESEIFYHETLTGKTVLLCRLQKCMDDQAPRYDRVTGKMVLVNRVIRMEIENTLPGILARFPDCTAEFIRHALTLIPCLFNW